MTQVSIIIPFYNAKKHIKKNFESCLKLLELPIEIIYVNDGSSGLNSSQYRLVGGLPVVKPNSFPFHTIRRIPYFLTHSNNNNPLQYKRNGQVIADFEYTYNVYGYPETMTVIRPNDENYIYSMAYEEID